MNIWEVLGIEATSETYVIKKAYAKKLRIHHPEEDPEGYQRLREAYDSALQQAPYFSSTVISSHDGKESRKTTDQLELTEETSISTISPIQQFMVQVDHLYTNFSERIKPEAWEQLLNEDIVWDVENSDDLKYALLSYLEDHHYLPRSVWEKLDAMFHIQDDKEELLDQHSEEFVDYMIEQIKGTTELRYDCFYKHYDPHMDHEHYLELREQAQFMFMENKLDEAFDYLSEANRIFEDDPDLQLMRGKYYISIGQLDAALQCFNKAIDLNSDDPEGYWHRAQIHIEQKNYITALADCTVLLDKEPDNIEVISLAGRIHLELGDIDQARDALTKSNKLDNRHIPSFIYLSTAANHHVYGKRSIDPAEKKRIVRNNITFDVMMVIRLSWLYILVYLILQLFFDVHPVFTGLLALLLLWNTIKAVIVHRTYHLT